MATSSVTTTFTPLHDRIQVRKLEEPTGYGETETTRGGIIIPDTAKKDKRVFKGEVVAVGKGKTNNEGQTFPLDVKAGDIVIFGQYSGNEIKVDGEEFFVMREDEVLGIIK